MPDRERSAVDRFREDVASRQPRSDDPDIEKQLWEGNYSPLAMLGAAIVVVIASVALIVVVALYSLFDWRIAVLIAFASWLLLAGVYLFRRFSIHYELTTQRFIHQSGLLSRRTDRIEVIDIDDVGFFQGPIQRILGIGTIDITSSDVSHPHLIMPGIADVKSVAGMIDDVRRRERKRRSLHIQTS